MQISIFLEIDGDSTVEQVKAALVAAGKNAAAAVPAARPLAVDEEISFSMGETNGYNASVYRPS